MFVRAHHAFTRPAFHVARLHAPMLCTLFGLARSHAALRSHAAQRSLKRPLVIVAREQCLRMIISAQLWKEGFVLPDLCLRCCASLSFLPSSSPSPLPSLPFLAFPCRSCCRPFARCWGSSHLSGGVAPRVSRYSELVTSNSNRPRRTRNDAKSVRTDVVYLFTSVYGRASLFASTYAHDAHARTRYPGEGRQEAAGNTGARWPLGLLFA